MPQILLDDARFDPPPGANTIGDLLREVRRTLQPRHRMIVGLSCDGSVIPDHSIDQTLGEPMARFESIELRSESPRTLTLSALRQARGSLHRLRAMRIEIADTLSAAKTSDAMQRLSEFIQQCAQAHEAVVQSASVLGIAIEHGGFQVDHRDWDFSAVTEALRQIKDALLAQDFVLLADQMRYEMEHTLDDWDAAIGAVIERVEQLPIEA